MTLPVVVRLRQPQAPFDQPSGTVALDGLVTWLLWSCTACGRPGPSVWAQVVPLDGVQRAVQLCRLCHGAPAYGGFRTALGRLVERYGPPSPCPAERRR